MREARIGKGSKPSLSFITFIKEFSVYYKPHKGLFAVDMISAFLISLCNLFYPRITQNIINIYVPNRAIKLLLVWAGVLLAIYLVKAALTYVVQYFGHLLGVKIQGDMRSKLFLHLQKLPFSYYDENKTGTIMSRLINDLFDISELAHHGPEDIFLSLITIVGAVIMMATIYWPLAVIVLAFLPLMVFCAVMTRREMGESFRNMRKATGEINARVENAVAGIRVSRAYTATEKEKEKFEEANTGYQTTRAKAYLSMGKFFTVMSLFNDLLYLLILVAGGLFFYHGKINAGEFTAFVLYIAMLLNPIRTLISIFEQLQSGISGFERYREVLLETPEEETGKSTEFPQGDIVYDDVDFSYVNKEGETQVLKNLTLTVPYGKTVALVGPSGGGKTTLCHLLPRFYELQGGKITVGGTDVKTLTRETLRKNVGIVQQDVFLFSGTIRENIMYGNLSATEEEMIAAAKKANIHEFVTTLANGYDSEVGERGVKLSGGQKQRISIARAFLKNPPVLLLDEATSALDTVTERQIQASLEELSKGRTTVVVAHRLSTVKNADLIYVITKEGVAESGTHEELLKLGGVYAGLSGEGEEL
ncbi:MAG: ABC transporter ATP-binding protein [Clostridia bacterium]|nr:ABC transporter ATP-binding protein [Clostridia bacterium]